ncbi:MAG: hypothetical protein JEY91_12530 [Spirochaetaceae bacterium]|nr:hypothetical protein [Spirochaetaceae bacterium]
MLLKRGDTWTENLPDWRKSGRSQIERMIIGAYGSLSDERPKLGAFTSNGGFDFLIASDLELSDSWRSVNFEGAFNHVLIEGCLVPPGPAHGMIIQNPGEVTGIDFFALRRNVIVGRYRPSGSTGFVQGIYIDAAINLLIEENIFDNNGKDEFGAYNGAQDLRCHNTYVMLGRGNGENHIWRYNISSRACSHGFQAGSGGLIEANLSVENPIGIAASRTDTWNDDGFPALITKNVILHGNDISPSDLRGWGILIENSYNSIVEDNIIGDNVDSGYPFGILVQANIRSGVQMYVRDLAINNNIIHNWNGNNTIDGKAMTFVQDAYSSGTVYSHGSTPDDFIRDVELTNNIVHTTNSELRLMNLNRSNLVTLSENNTFYGTRTSDQLFRVGGANYNFNNFLNLISDTTSNFNTTSPNNSYGITDYLSGIGEESTFSSFYSHIRQQRKGFWDGRYTAVPIINFVRNAFGRNPVEYNYDISGISGTQYYKPFNIRVKN